jgi:hypothetical protein
MGDEAKRAVAHGLDQLHHLTKEIFVTLNP